jgi:hypothetical protein
MTIYYSKTTGGFYDPNIHLPEQIPGDAVEITEAAHQQLLSLQSNGKQIVGDSSGSPTVIDPESLFTLRQIKDSRLSYINIKRQESFNTGFVFDGVIYDSDDQAKTNITGVMASIIAGIPLPLDFTWRSKDNNNIPMDVQKFSAFASAFFQNYQSVMKRSWALKDFIESRTTKNQVNKIDWDFPLEE